MSSYLHLFIISLCCFFFFPISPFHHKGECQSDGGGARDNGGSPWLDLNSKSIRDDAVVLFGYIRLHLGRVK